ncbi:hypothetical protein MY3296_009966 [Beauveria thailandica]
MRPDRRKAAPAPLQLRSIQRREESTRVKSPSTSRARTPSPTRTWPLSGNYSPTRLLSPEKEVSMPSSPGSARSTSLPTSRPTVSSPTVTVTLTVTGPTITATASQQVHTSSHAILPSTQSAALIPSTSSTAGAAAASKAIIPIKAVGFVAGITGAAGALIAIGLFIFFWRRRRAAAAAAPGGREGE